MVPDSPLYRKRGLTPWEHCVHGLVVAGFVISAVTGFSNDVGFGELEGWKLLIHMAGAGLFTLGLAAVTLLWAARSRFGPLAPEPRVPLNVAQKWLFWLAVLVGWLVMLPMLLAMLPVLGTVAQRQLVDWHKLAAIALVVLLVLHTVVSAATWWKRGRAS